MASPTPNKGMTYPAHGGAVNSWDTPLNTDFDILDVCLGGNYSLTMVSTASGVTFNSSYATISSTVATVVFPSTTALNLSYTLTGTLAQNLTFTFPAVGGIYDFYNNSSGAFSVTANTAGGGTSQSLGQGSHTLLIADGTNISQADNSVVAQMYTYLGSPSGAVSGNAGTANGAVTTLLWDATNKQFNVPTVGGSTATTIWKVMGPVIPEPGGYLTPVSSTPIITADSLAVTTLYYTPYKSNWAALGIGNALIPYQFSQLTLSLASSAVTAGGIFDVFIGYISSSDLVTIGTGPNWTVGGGSVTAGSGARGTGAGSTNLTRMNGLWVNTVAMTLANGAPATSISSGCGVFVGSIYISGAAGTVTQHRTWGSNRQWNVSNAYNKTPTYLKAGDATASWSPASGGAFRVSNNSTANSITLFSALPEDYYDISNEQVALTIATGNTTQLGIGVNSTSATTGKVGRNTAASATITTDLVAAYQMPPALGINTLYSLESTTGAATVYGTETNMILAAKWMV